ncbi:MAG: CHAT domain-containing tetratricopeptide repeat protein [Verrucomicrobiae bacterium]|nr:CHAT domain-containing tetratricopeptide repeat protein [Verrucomicrobiae bacterium]
MDSSSSLPACLCVLLLTALLPLPAQTNPVSSLQKKFGEARELYRTGQKEEALARALDNQNAALESLDFRNPDTIQGFIELSDMYQRLNRHRDSAEVLQNALRLASEELGEDHPLKALVDYTLGWHYANLADYSRARDHFQKALQVREQHFGRRSAETAEVLNSLAVLHENLGDFSQAEPLFLEALSIQRAVLGDNHAKTATTLNNLGTHYWTIGDNRQADRCFSEALEIRRRVLGRSHLSTATSLNNLGLLYRSMGDFDLARKMFRRVIQTRSEALGPNHPLTLTALNNLALLYMDQKRYVQARPLLEKVVEGRRAVLNADHPDLARALFNLALAEDRMGHFEASGPLAQSSLEMRLKTLGPHHPETAGSYYTLGRLAHRQGRFAEAAGLYNQALQIQMSALGPTHSDTIHTLENLAFLALDQGNRGVALKINDQLWDIRRHQIEKTFSFAPEKQRLSFSRTLNALDLPGTLGDPGRIAATALRTKGVVLDSVLEERRILEGLDDAPARNALQELKAVTRKLSQFEPDSSPHTANGLHPEREDLEEQKQRLEKILAEKTSVERASRSALTLDPESLRKALPPKTALVEFIVFQRSMGRLEFEPALGAVILTRDTPPRWVDLGPLGPVEKEIRQYQRWMRRPVKESALRKLLSALHGKIWAPLAGTIPAGTTRLMIVPDGALNLISFGTLLTPADRLLLEDFQIEYLAAGRDLLRPVSALNTSRALVIFANPSFLVGTKSPAKSSAQNGSLIAPETPLPALPGSLREARLLEKQAPAWGLSPRVLTNTRATEPALASLPPPHILHLATHGLFVPPRPEEEDNSTDPMDRSLLALAGAQNTFNKWNRGVFPDPSSDGVLTAREMASLNLNGTWLVVLSACDTAVGETLIGEGVMGFRRGLTQAGAQNLLMTLWPVKDSETAPLIEAFYSRLVKTNDPARALCEAQREALRKMREKDGFSTAVRTVGPFILSR